MKRLLLFFTFLIAIQMNAYATKIDHGGRVELRSNGKIISPNNPLPTDDGSVHSKDLDLPNCSIGDFSGAITDLFDSRTSTITTSADNPTLNIALALPIHNQEITFVSSSGNFSNAFIVAKDASGTTLETIDDSSNDTKYTSNSYYFTTIDKWCVLEVSFKTTDDVTLSYVDINKAIHVYAHLHALKPNGTVTAIDATAGGNLKNSIEEYDAAVTPFRVDMEGGGKVEVGTTAVEATFTGTPKAIIITADIDNTGILYIGESNVTNLGANAITFLQAGESIHLSYDDSSNAVYVVSDTASQNFWKGALL